VATSSAGPIDLTLTCAVPAFVTFALGEANTRPSALVVVNCWSEPFQAVPAALSTTSRKW
jgi:hypothetical protein